MKFNYCKKNILTKVLTYLVIFCITIIISGCKKQCQITNEDIDTSSVAESAPKISSPKVKNSQQDIKTYAQEDAKYYDTNEEDRLNNLSDNYFISRQYKKENCFLSYLFHIPARQSQDKVPLIIHLHGKGENISSNNFGLAGQLVRNLCDLEKNDKNYSCYVLMPISPSNNDSWWSESQYHSFTELLTDIIQNYNIDPKRVYISGISMGGYATCEIMDRMPENTFAAAVPMCGASKLKNAAKHINTAFRIYHATRDNVVPAYVSEELYSQLINSGNKNVTYTKIDSDMHTAPANEAFFKEGVDFYSWLFEQRLP